MINSQVRVKNLVLSHQSVSVQVEGLIEGAELSKPNGSPRGSLPGEGDLEVER